MNLLIYKKPGSWILTTSIIAVSLVCIGFATNSIRGNGDSSYLNIINITSLAAQQEQILIRVNDSGGTYISGKEFSRLLEAASSNWTRNGEVKSDENTADLTVYINVGADHEICFYKSQPELAMVKYDGKFQYYKVPKDSYDKVFFMYAIRSYVIPKEVMKAITDGKKTNMQSLQDTPDSGDYKILRVGNEKYFIYKKGSKYYGEQPYQFIREITEKIYEDALKFAEEPASMDTKISVEIRSINDNRKHNYF